MPPARRELAARFGQREDFRIRRHVDADPRSLELYRRDPAGGAISRGASKVSARVQK